LQALGEALGFTASMLPRWQNGRSRCRLAQSRSEQTLKLAALGFIEIAAIERERCPLCCSPLPRTYGIPRRSWQQRTFIRLAGTPEQVEALGFPIPTDPTFSFG
jgi:hypothetical protein